MKKPNNLESQIQQILRKNNLRHTRQHYVGNYPVDFFLLDYNLSIQVDGCWVHFHECCEGKKKYPRHTFTRRRDKACNMYHKYSKVNILRISECQLKGAEDLIFKTISRIIKGEHVYA